MRPCYYEINVRASNDLFIGGNKHPQALAQDRTYYLTTNLGVVLKIAFRWGTWRLKQVAGRPVRRDRAQSEGWSDCIYHPGPVSAYVFGIGHGFAKADVAERTHPNYLAACNG